MNINCKKRALRYILDKGKKCKFSTHHTCISHTIHLAAEITFIDRANEAGERTTSY